MDDSVKLFKEHTTYIRVEKEENDLGKLKGLNKKFADYESDFYKRDLTEVEKKAIYDPDKHYLDTDLMVEEIHKRTRLPRFICTMVYYAEGRIMQDVGLMS